MLSSGRAELLLIITDAGKVEALQILALSGSLRVASTNTALLRIARRAAPPGIAVSIYDAIGQLPLFNPDLDGEMPPQAVVEFRALVGRSEGILVACPEYAHGIPGAFKNALDWLVGSTEFPGKPVALLQTSSRAIHVQAALREVLATMSARIVSETSITVLPDGKRPDPDNPSADPDIIALLRSVLNSVAQAT